MAFRSAETHSTLAAFCDKLVSPTRFTIKIESLEGFNTGMTSSLSVLIVRVLCVVMISGLILASPTLLLAQKDEPGDPSGTVLPPVYQIFDMGVTQGGDTASQGFGVSSGGVGVGRSIRASGSSAFTWTQAGGIVGLANLSGRTFCVANGTNDNNRVAGTCANSLFGTARLPVIWINGAVAPLTLPTGETLGDANDVNSGAFVVGSAGSGSTQKAVIYFGPNFTLISQTTSTGCFFNTAFGINDAGRIVGTGIDPNNAARNVGMVFDMGQSQAFEVGALPGANGALAFGISNGGHVVGSSMMNQGSGLPFIWTQGGGMVAIPLPTGTTQGSARAVNSSGQAVGTASSAFAIPFLYTGGVTFRLADLIPSGSGWDLSTNTSSSALGISDGGVIVGTGVFNGAVHAYAMVPMASNVSVGGRILTAGGAGIANARVTISGANLPSPLTTQTGPLGWYNFSGLQGGSTYTVTVEARRHTFAASSQMVTPSGNVTNLDFTAQ